MNLVSSFGVYMGNPITGQEDGYMLQRAPVTYQETDKALKGLHDYAKALPGSLFILVDEDNQLFVKATKWADEQFYYSPDIEGQSAAFLFHEHTHNHAGD